MNAGYTNSRSHKGCLKIINRTYLVLEVIKYGSKGRNHIQEELKKRGIEASIRCIGEDISFLKTLGADIVASRRGVLKHRLINSDFNLFNSLQNNILCQEKTQRQTKE